MSYRREYTCDECGMVFENKKNYNIKLTKFNDKKLESEDLDFCNIDCLYEFSKKVGIKNEQNHRKTKM